MLIWRLTLAASSLTSIADCRANRFQECCGVFVVQDSYSEVNNVELRDTRPPHSSPSFCPNVLCRADGAPTELGVVVPVVPGSARFKCPQSSHCLAFCIKRHSGMCFRAGNGFSAQKHTPEEKLINKTQRNIPTTYTRPAWIHEPPAHQLSFR